MGSRFKFNEVPCNGIDSSADTPDAGGRMPTALGFETHLNCAGTVHKGMAA